MGSFSFLGACCLSVGDISANLNVGGRSAAGREGQGTLMAGTGDGSVALPSAASSGLLHSSLAHHLPWKRVCRHRGPDKNNPRLSVSASLCIIPWPSLRDAAAGFQFFPQALQVILMCSQGGETLVPVLFK